MPLQSGCYYICNVKQRNIIFLKNDNDYEPLRGIAYPGRIAEDTGEKWDVTVFRNGKCTLQSARHTSYASTRTGHSLTSNDLVEAKTSGVSPAQYFCIEETNIRGQYTISATSSRLYWFLKDDESDTPIGLSPDASDPRCLWTFKSPSTLELQCAISFDQRQVSSTGVGPGYQLTVEDDGGVDDDTWLLTHHSGSKYIIRDFRADIYVRPNDKGTYLVTGEKRYAWTIKPDKDHPSCHIISTKRGGRQLMWTVKQSETMSYVGLTEDSESDSMCRILLIDPSDHNMQRFDYSANRITPEEFAGHLNSIHPDVQKRAIENIQIVVRNSDVMTDELLEALALVKSHSSPAARVQITEALKSIAEILFDALKHKTPLTTRKLIIQLLESIVKDQKYMQQIPFEICPAAITCLVDDLRLEDDETVMSVCNILRGIQSRLAKVEAEIIMQNLSYLLGRQQGEAVVATLHLLLSTVKVHQMDPDEEIIQQVKEIAESPDAQIKLPAMKVIDELEQGFKFDDMSDRSVHSEGDKEDVFSDWDGMGSEDDSAHSDTLLKHLTKQQQSMGDAKYLTIPVSNKSRMGPRRSHSPARPSSRLNRRTELSHEIRRSSSGIDLRQTSPKTSAVLQTQHSSSSLRVVIPKQATQTEQSRTTGRTDLNQTATPKLSLQTEHLKGTADLGTSTSSKPEDSSNKDDLRQKASSAQVLPKEQSGPSSANAKPRSAPAFRARFTYY
ncbi:hypothetical protein AMATHDRAFT_6867 [Amanita thiersii Skay4041]|uniref:Ricin B lectin domain-containing protein n=1 Tax=Amanita thiersii Skay4041 TaxID=703135 RepID=A0A2A9NHR4_9AGAR|nr:hypothetical protein AMATHDRAFT_6867 [Amanita thiersii Skay4041]